MVAGIFEKSRRLRTAVFFGIETPCDHYGRRALRHRPKRAALAQRNESKLAVGAPSCAGPLLAPQRMGDDTCVAHLFPCYIPGETEKMPVFRRQSSMRPQGQESPQAP